MILRLLHTADWHLGRIFYGTYLTEDQAYVLEHQLMDIIEDSKVDGILLAGDVFDRSVPPVEAIELWDSIITRIAMDYKIPIFVIAGNHDGAERLELGRTMMARSNVFLWGTPEHCKMPLIYEFYDGSAAICALPFAEPRRIASALITGEDDVVTTHHDYDYMYQHWSDYLRWYIPKGMRSIALSHAFVSGGELGGSERLLSVGASEIVRPAAFKNFHYTALGHLHAAQRIGADYIRYSGSPLKYSFDEYKQNKSFTIVDMDIDGNVVTETIPVVAKRDVVVLEGYFEDLLNNDNLRNIHKDDYVMARLLDTAPVIDGMAKLRKLYPHCMTIELVGRMEQVVMDDMMPVYRHLDERQLFNQFAEAVWKEPLSEQQQDYINQLWNRIVKED